MDINTEHVKSSDRIWTVQTSAGKSIIEESVVTLQFGRESKRLFEWRE